MTDRVELAGAVALVTGASSGIGKAIVHALLDRGAKVIAAARSSQALSALARETGDSVYPLTLDVRDAEAAAALVDSLPAEWRTIDILINAAGHDVGGRQRFDAQPATAWTDIVETNLVGMIQVTHAVALGMVAREKGDIVNLGSIAGFTPYPGGTAYAASKFGVHAFSESLRMDFGKAGIRVIEIMPGLTRSAMAERRFGDEQAGADYYDSAPMTLDPEDVASTVVFALELPRHATVAQLVLRPRID